MEISEKLGFYLQLEIGKCMQLWTPEDPLKSSQILEKKNLFLMKAVDTFSRAFTSTIKKTSVD